MNVILNTQYHSDSLSLCLSPSHVVIGYVDCSTVCHTETNKTGGIYIYIYII